MRKRARVTWIGDSRLIRSERPEHDGTPVADLIPNPQSSIPTPSIIPPVLTGSMLALGFLHGLGADHLMAIAALSLATPLGPARYARAFGLALRFAVGHAVLLALGAGLVLFFGWQIPVRFEQGGEFIGGCLLIALGLAVGWLTV